MDLPDCPPGAEGYEDSFIEMPKKPNLEEGDCTKAEQEFQEHLNSLKIQVENEEARCMVERRGRDVSGKWIYLCYPCAAVCSGESILQTHISGKKHKTKLSIKNVWPKSIFDEHPYILSEKGVQKEKKDGAATEKVLQKMVEEVNFHNNTSDLDKKYNNKYRNVRCHIQDSLDGVKAPLVGIEYLVEHPPEQEHYEPSYICTLCQKQGHPRTIINHMTCFWHRHNFISRHYSKATLLLTPYRTIPRYREGVSIIINRLCQRIEGKFGRLKPVNIDKEEYEKEKDLIYQWLCKSYHFSEKDGPTFEEVVDIGLIESLHKSNLQEIGKKSEGGDKKDPSPPVVAAPSKPLFNSYTRPAGRQERRGSLDALSDISDEPAPQRRDVATRSDFPVRFETCQRESPPRQHRYSYKNRTAAEKNLDKVKPPNYEYKVKLANEQRKTAEEAAKKTLAYHEKNPEKHPMYPEEWKKFWNRRYKEIQAEGKDAAKHDFKPEWILYWTGRMKELHEEELRVHVSEIYRRMCLPLPDLSAVDDKKDEPRPGADRRRSPDLRRRSPERRRSPSPRRRSADRRRASPRRRSPPRAAWRSPERRREPERLSRNNDDRYRRDFRSPGRRRSPERRPAPLRGHLRSRSPVHSRTRSPPRTHIEIESVRRSRSPLSRRADPALLRNRSPHREPPPSMQTVLVSDDELKPDDGISPWNSDDSLGSLPEARSPAHLSRAGSEMSRASRPRYASRETARPADPSDLGPPENVVATLRLLVALEDYLGSLGPKVVDLLTEALTMEKEKANSSEELLVRDSAVVLIETAKEKLKGAVQAGLVAAAAAPAVRAAVVRAAATLHAADTRQRSRTQSAIEAAVSALAAQPAPARGGLGARKRTRTRTLTRRKRQLTTEQKAAAAKPLPVPVAGVGVVDRAQIAQQMAAALVAQGKTDVSSEELAQLVDAVVGMAEAKKREQEVQAKVSARAPAKAPAPRAPAGKTASALQMLQSAYDENEKRIEKEDAPEAPDAMDGLSDSDLETLLKNFNELSAEEQHSLIAYLKKLEAREPQRVERLRQYVSADPPPAAAAPPPATAAPAPAVGSNPPLKPAADDNAIPIDSDDDDDYTVEEVFQSATQKVKEDQMRQEMEIVKKSLEEIKAVTLASDASSRPIIDLTKHMSQASDLFALVQASVQSAVSNPPPTAAEVVTSHTQPRSFGDAPKAPEPIKSLAAGSTPAQGYYPEIRPPTNMNTFGNDQSQGSWNQSPMDGDNSNTQDNTGSFNEESTVPFNQDNRGGPFNQNSGSFNQNSAGFNQNSGGFNQNQPFNHNQDNRGNFPQDNRGNFGENNRAPFGQSNLRPLMQDNSEEPMQDKRGFAPHNNGPPMQDNRGGFQDNNNAQRNTGFSQFGQNNSNQINQGNRGNFMNGRLPDQKQQQFGNQQQPQFGNQQQPQFGNQQQPQFGNQQQPQFGNHQQPTFGNHQQPQFGNQQQPQFGNQQQPQFGNQQQPQFGNQQQPQFGNQQHQQFGNQQNNFRGRGRGNFGGPMRGRGRGAFY